jgi:hypothetical protein
VRSRSLGGRPQEDSATGQELRRDTQGRRWEALQGRRGGFG